MATVRIRQPGRKPVVRHYSFGSIVVSDRDAVFLFERREDKMTLSLSKEEVDAIVEMLKGGKDAKQGSDR